MKRILIACLAAAISITTAGCLPFSLKTTEKEIGTIAQESLAKNEAKSSVQPTETEAPPTKPAAVKPGNYVQDSKLKISLIKASQYNEIESNKYYTNTPSNGKKYLVLFFEVENVSNQEDYINSLNFKAYEDSYNTRTTTVLDDIDGYPDLIGEALMPGKKMKGYLIYEVNPDWKEFEVSYQGIDDRESYDFLVTPNDLTK